MYPYHHDPKTDAAIYAETLAFFAWIKRKFKDLWEWLRSPMPEPSGHAQFIPSVSGMGSFWTECTTPGCNCGGARERGDMPPSRPPAELEIHQASEYPKVSEAAIVVTGEPIGQQVQRVFGHFGKVKGLFVEDDGSIHVSYQHGVNVRFLALSGPVQSVVYEGL